MPTLRQICLCAFPALLLLTPLSARADLPALDREEHKTQSIEELERAVAANPQDFDSLMALGMAWLEQGESTKAVETLETAISVKPDFARAHLLLAWAYNERLIEFPISPRTAGASPETSQAKGQMTEVQRSSFIVQADGEFETALRLDPADAYAWTLWGHALLRRSQNNILMFPSSDPEPIEAKFRKALEIDPDHRRASAGLAGLLYAYGSLYQHHLEHPGGPTPPAWAPEDLAGAVRGYLVEATEIYWSFVRELPEVGTKDTVSLYERLLGLLLFLERDDEALTLCREHIDPGNAPYWLSHHFTRHWRSALKAMETRDGEGGRYRASSAAYQQCRAWLASSN